MNNIWSKKIRKERKIFEFTETQLCIRNQIWTFIAAETKIDSNETTTKTTEITNTGSPYENTTSLTKFEEIVISIYNKTNETETTKMPFISNQSFPAVTNAALSN